MHCKIFVSAALFLLCLLPLSAVAQTPTDDQIKAYLEKHPEVVMEVLSRHKVELYNMVMDGREISRRLAWRRNIKRGLAKPLLPQVNPKRVLLGDPQAKAMIVEYTDFLCPACRQAARNMEHVLGKYPHHFKLLVKHLPGSDTSRQLALYYEAIGRQDPAKAWRFYQEAFHKQDLIADKGLAEVHSMVAKLGIDQGRLTRDLADKSLTQRLDDDLAEAKAFKINGVPAFIAAGVMMNGPAPAAAFEDVWAISQGKELAPLDAGR